MSSLALIVIALIVIYCCKLLFQQYVFAQKLNKIPGLPGSTFGLGIRSGLTFWNVFSSSTSQKIPNRLAQFMSSMLSMFPGGITRVWIGPIPTIFVSKPEFVQAFMTNHKSEIRKGIFYKFMKPFFGNGLITSAGDVWKHQRKMLTPAFHFKILEHAIPVMNKNGDILVQMLEKGMSQNKEGIIDNVGKYILHASLDIMSETAMGQEINAQRGSESEYVRANRNISHGYICRIINPWFAFDFFFDRSKVGKQFNDDIALIHRMIDDLIQVKRKQLLPLVNKKKAIEEATTVTDETKPDNLHEDEENFANKLVDEPSAFLDIMMRYHMESPEELSLPDLRDQILTFISAGYETSGSALIWITYLLSLHPEIQQRLQEELDQEFTDGDYLKLDQLKQGLPYTEAVIKETMRLFPTIPGFARQLDHDIEIEGYTIPATTVVAFNVMSIHRNPEHWENPNRFNPDRFLSDKGGNKHHPFAYIPFSAGARNCIGQRFAMLELKLLVAKMFHKYTITNPDPGDYVDTRVAVALAAGSDIRVKLEPRSHASMLMQGH